LAPVGIANGQPPMKVTKHVELLIDKRCQIYRMRALDMFTELRKSSTHLRRKTVLEVNNKEECAELCLNNNKEYFSKYRNFNLIDLKTSNLTAIRKHYFKSLKEWCSTFRYLDLKTSSIVNEVQDSKWKLGEFKKDGVCLLSRPRGGHLRRYQSEDDAQAAENQVTPVFEMDHCEFNYLNLYEMRANTMMLAYNEDSAKPDRPTNRRVVAHMSSPEECAKACFTQTTELVPFCKSFEFGQMTVLKNETTEESVHSEIVTTCSFNSMSISDATEAGLRDVIVVNQTGPSIVALHHYEPHQAYLINAEFLKSLTKSEQIDQSVPNTSGLVLMSIVIVALISGLFLGYHAEQPVLKCLISMKEKRSMERGQTPYLAMNERQQQSD
jgi:hypothetical protein